MKRLIVICFLCSLLVGNLAFGKDRRLKGLVLLIGENNEEVPAKAVEVIILEIGSSEFTDRNGVFDYPLRDRDKAGKPVQFEIEIADYAIQDPVKGYTKIPKDKDLEALLKIFMMKKGSPKLLTDARIEKTIEEGTTNGRDQVNPAKKDIKEGNTSVDLNKYFDDQAKELRLTPENFRERVQQWAAHTERKERNPQKLALAAASWNDFGRAGDQHNRAAEILEQQFQTPKPKKQNRPLLPDLQVRPHLVRKQNTPSQEDIESLRYEIVKEFRLAGDSYYNDYAFEKALTAYQRAVRYLSKEESPDLWASVISDIGLANTAVGIRTEGEGIHQHLTQAVAAYRDALQVYTREQLPQQWATTQNNLGTTLSEQGIRTGGEEGRQLLAQAVAAYRDALQVRSREHLPKDWAQTQNNLAKASLYLDDWPQAAESYRNVLILYPDYAEAYLAANGIYQEKLFAYADAFEVTKQWLQRHPDDLPAHMNFAEAHFTAGRFKEAEARLRALLTEPLDAQATIPLQALHVAALSVLNKPDAIPEKLEALREAINKQSKEFRLGWSFAGTKHFINRDERLADHRIWLLQLFGALEQKDRDSILTALQIARENFRPL